MPVLRPEKLSDLELLGRLKGLAWLSAAQLKELDESILVRSVKRNGVIFQELGKPSAEVHILLSGAAQLSHLNGDGPRVVAMMMPGVIFRLPQMPPEVGHNFEWVALSDCKVGRLPLERYVSITLGVEFGVQNHRGVVLGIVPTHKQIADLVGASRPKVSEIMNDLQRRKALSRDGRKLTVTIKRLEAIVESGADA